MKLAKLYAESSGVEVRKPTLQFSFYPVPKKYIIFANGGGNGNFSSKQYDYYADVIDLIKPYLDKENIEIVQIGTKNDQPLEHCLDLREKTSYSQVNYVIKNSLLLVGNDSFSSHVSGILDVKSITVFGPTVISAHSSFWGSCYSKNIDSHRNGNLPSCSPIENPKSINLIPPQEIAQDIISLLFNFNANFNSCFFIGNFYSNIILETLPNQIIPREFAENQIINIRADYQENWTEDNEKIIYANIQNRKCTVLTDKKLDLNILKVLKDNLSQLIVDIDENINLDWVIETTKSGLNVQFISFLPTDKLNKVKEKLCDYAVINKKEKIKVDELIKRSAKWSNLSEEDFKNKIKGGKLTKQSSKIVLSDGKIYNSYADLKKDIYIDDIKASTPCDLTDDNNMEDFEFFKLSITAETIKQPILKICQDSKK